MAGDSLFRNLASSKGALTASTYRALPFRYAGDCLHRRSDVFVVLGNVAAH